MKKGFKLLLATDYSEAVMNAERYAVQFAVDTQSDLILMHAYDAPEVSTPARVMNGAELDIETERSEMDRLEMHRDKLFRMLQIEKETLNCECIVHEGNAAAEICEEAKKRNVDFIVVGTHGATGFRKVFFGTHAWQVIKKSSAPVLAIPKDGMFMGVKNIVFAVGEREGELPVVNFLAELAKKFDAELTILHITTQAISKHAEEELHKKFRTEVLEKISYEKLNLRLIYNEDILRGINDFCTRKKADWLVMSHEKSFEQLFIPDSSVTKQMSLSTEIPLLSVPDFYDPENSEFWKLFEMDERFLNEEF